MPAFTCRNWGKPRQNIWRFKPGPYKYDIGVRLSVGCCAKCAENEVYSRFHLPPPWSGADDGASFSNIDSVSLSVQLHCQQNVAVSYASRNTGAANLLCTVVTRLPTCYKSFHNLPMWTVQATCLATPNCFTHGPLCPQSVHTYSLSIPIFINGVRLLLCLL